MPATLTFLSALFTVISGYFLYSGLRLETAVRTEFAPAGFEGVANLQLMHMQAMNLQMAIGAAIVAAIFFCASAILQAVNRRPPA